MAKSTKKKKDKKKKNKELSRQFEHVISRDVLIQKSLETLQEQGLSFREFSREKSLSLSVVMSVRNGKATMDKIVNLLDLLGVETFVAFQKPDSADISESHKAPS